MRSVILVSVTDSYEQLKVLTAVTMNIAFFCDVASLSLVYLHAIADFSSSPVPMCETSWHHIPSLWTDIAVVKNSEKWGFDQIIWWAVDTKHITLWTLF